MMENEYLLIIPARLASTRLPNKPLLDIEGKTMIERTFDNCCKAVSRKHIYVATDSLEIYNLCISKSINVELTSESCLTGTDRVAEFAEKHKANYYINVQGDEPLINPDDIKLVINSIKVYPESIINCYTEILDQDQFFSLSIPKVTFDTKCKLLYMSRSPIPGNKNGNFQKAWRQVCIYSFPADSLKKFNLNKFKSNLEEIEDIEILRFLEMGFSIQMLEVSGNSLAVDTESDLLQVREIFRKLSNEKS